MSTVVIPGIKDTEFEATAAVDGGSLVMRLWGNADLPFASGFDPYRHSAELTWRNSEFSLFRLQVSHDKPNPGDSDNAVTVQYQTSLGAHGAHKF